MALSERSKFVRREAILLSKANGGYHYGGSFSCAEILINLYDHILQPRDLFLLSKGHACWVFYVLLREKGLNPRLEGHPHFDPTNGIYCTAGSMGHGLPMALGLALGKRQERQEGRIFVLMGDGECQEGTTWESLILAGKLKLGNLTAIVDLNGIQGSGYLRDIVPIKDPLVAAASAAGWSVIEIDGHTEELRTVSYSNENRPSLVIARTIKGKGVSFMEDSPKWHSNWLGGELEKQALEELS